MLVTTSTSHARDKSSWPQIQPLPATLAEPAKAAVAKYTPNLRFSAGSIADARDGIAARVSPTWDFGTQSVDATSIELVGRDASRALAAAVARAGAAQVQPANEYGAPASSNFTMIGLYHVGDFWLTAPMWHTPGTNDWQRFLPLDATRASNSDLRFSFRDDRLAALVATDGFVVNPAYANTFHA